MMAVQKKMDQKNGVTVLRVNDLEKYIQAKALTGAAISEEADQEITDVYCCDLLSRVMAQASRGIIWVTVLTHTNIIAVAQLGEIGAIVVPEDIPVPQQTVDKAVEEGVNIFSSPLTAYEISWKLHDHIGNASE